MRIEVKEKNEDGDIVTAGTLNQTEVNYLVQFAINSLMAMGAEFDLKEQEKNDKDEEILRIKMPKGTTLQ